MRTVFVVVSSCSEPVAVFSDERKAIKCADGYGDRFQVRGFHLDDEDAGCGWLVWIRGVSESQIEAANIIASKRYVKTKPEQYAAALRKLLKLEPGLTLEVVAQRIGKPVNWIEKLFQNNPEPKVTEKT